MTQRSTRATLALGFVVPIALQSAITVVLGSLAARSKVDFLPVLFLSFAITGGVGFIFLTKLLSGVQKVFVALGYFPLMFMVFYFEALVMLGKMSSRGSL
jgi:hypothetical protein